MPDAPEGTAVPRPDREAAGPRRLPTVLLRSIALKFGIYAVNASTGILTARALNVSGRGALAAMILWPALVSGLTTVGLPSALVYRMRRAPEHGSELVGAAFLISVATGLIATVLGWHMVPLWLAQQPQEIVRGAQICLLATTIYSIGLVGRATWEAEGRFDQSNLIQLIPPLTTILLLVPLGLSGRLTPDTAAAAYVLASVPTTTWAVLSVVRVNRPTLQRWRERTQELLHFGSRSYGVDLCGVLALYVDQALVVGLLAPEAMGLYVVGLSVARVINAIQGSVALIEFPRMVGFDAVTLRVSIARSARLSALASAAFGLLILVAGSKLVTVVYGRSFEPTARALPLFICEVVLAGLAHVLLQGFMASNRPGVATLVQLTGLVLSVPVFLGLIPAWGLTGAAVALLISTSIRLLLTVAAYPLFLGVPIPRVWIGWSDVVDLAAYREAVWRSFTRFRLGEAK